MVKEATVRFGAGTLIAEGLEFARDAWRDCWLPMLLVVLGHTLMFANLHTANGGFGWIGALLLIFYVPLFGGLYRAALGGKPWRGLGPGGLQWRGEEWRLIWVAVVVWLFIALVSIPFVALSGIAALIFGRQATLNLGPLGQWASWAPAGVVIWLLFFAVVAPRIARLSLGWPYSMAQSRTEPLAGWTVARHLGWPIAWALLFAWVPVLVGQLAIYALTLILPEVFASDYWPALAALGIGVVLAVLKVVVSAPIAVGVLVHAFARLEGKISTTVVAPAVVAPGMGGPLLDDPVPAHAEPVIVEPAVDAPHSAELSPGVLATGAVVGGAVVGGAALASHEATEPAAEPATEAAGPEAVTDTTEPAVPTVEPAATEAPPVEAVPETPTTETVATEPETPAAAAAPEPAAPKSGLGALEGAIAAALAAGAAAVGVTGRSKSAPVEDAAPASEPAEPPAPPKDLAEPVSHWPHSVLPVAAAPEAGAAESVPSEPSALASGHEPAQPS